MRIENQIYHSIDCDKSSNISCQLVIFDHANEKVKTIKLASIDVEAGQKLLISCMSDFTFTKSL